MSTRKQQDEGHGLESQELRCREYAARKGYHVEETFHDSFTGGGNFTDRPAMQALLAYLDEHSDTDYIIIFDDLKRFARDVRFHWELRTELASRNATVECPNFRFEETPEGEFIETILAAQGELERKQNRRQTAQKMKARLMAGYWSFHHPPGYRYQKRGSDGRVLVPYRPEAELIAEAFEGFATGRFHDQQQVAQFLRERGFKERVHPSQVRRILSRVLYAGYIEYEPWGVLRRKGQHEPIITLETFEQVQDRLNDKSPVRLRRDYRPDFPLRGFVACSECSKKLTASYSTGAGGRYAYYRCNNRECSVSPKNVPRAQIEDRFKDVLKDITPDQDVLYLAEALAWESWQARMAGGNEEARWEREKNDCEAEIEQVALRAARSQNERLVAAYEARVAELEKRVQLLEERLERGRTETPDFGTALGEVLGLVKSPYDVWTSGELQDRKNLLTIAFLGPIPYSGESGFGTPDLSPGFALFQEIQGVSFRDVRITADKTNGVHNCRSGNLVRIMADNSNGVHCNRSGYPDEEPTVDRNKNQSLQCESIGHVFKTYSASFERWVLDSYERLRPV